VKIIGVKEINKKIYIISKTNTLNMLDKPNVKFIYYR